MRPRPSRRRRCGLLGLSLVLLSLRRQHSAWAFHPLSDHHARYDFQALSKTCPELLSHVFVSPKTRENTVDWSSPDAVSCLNKALLMQHYGISSAYSVPAPYLSAGVPGRADYVHHLLADLVDAPGRGDATLRGLDIGTGANAIFPLIATHKYPNVEIVGTDIDAAALAVASLNVQCSPSAARRVTLRLQPSARSIFANVIHPGEHFAFTMCNPPFHASLAAAQAATARKARNLSSGRNFAGDKELYCEGGELGFITRMMGESAQHRQSLGWVTTLVSAGSNLAALERVLAGLSVRRVEVVPLEAGHKSTRILAWRFN